jgi:uncharacterized protein YegL
MNTQKIYNLIILDASGSMSAIYNQALSGVNETIATIRMAQEQHPDLEQYLTLASFSAGENFLNRIYSAKPIAEVRDITREDYPLLGCTALYDAMGTTISELQQKLSHDDRVLVTIITDGYENASRTWSGSQIKSLVEELRQMGWTFTYIGADQDVEKVAGGIGVRNCLRFSADEASTLDTFAKERSSRRRYYGAMQAKRLRCESSLSEDTDFFAEEKRMPEVDRQEPTKKGSVLAKLLKRK